MKKLLITLFTTLLIVSSAFANDGDKATTLVSKNLVSQTTPSAYSSLGTVTLFWKDVRTGVSTEINNINFLPGKPVLNVLGVANKAGELFTGADLAWNLVQNRNGDFNVSLVVGITFDMTFGTIRKDQPGVGFQVNWKTN